MTKVDSSIYYDIRNDLEAYPDAAIYIVIGGRGTGKTYSTLRYCTDEDEKYVFMKRTNKDIDLMCHNPKKDSRFEVELSPFKSLNRDYNYNIHAVKLYEGFGGFWKMDAEGDPIGDVKGYILSFNAVSKFKGFDLSDCNFIVFDEFIPLPYERTNRHEGIELLDLYRTIGRDNNIRTGKILKLICLANSMTVSCPIINDFELTDIIVDMKANGISAKYLKERAIFIRIVPDINGFREKESKNPIYKAMRGTKWAQMSLDNDFAYNDFSNVVRRNLKNYRCLIHLKNKLKDYYIYVGDGGYYMTYRSNNKYEYDYDLNLENDQKRFYVEWGIDLRAECIDNRMKFETYEMYDLIVNYKDFYKL